MHPKYRKTCRVCGSSNLTPVIDLGEQYLQGSFVKPGVTPPPTRKLPTELVRCDVTMNEDGCGLLQLAHSFPPEILYANYWYRSGTNQTMRTHLQGIVTSALSIVNNDNLSVLDIGCNDGTLLSNYPKGTQLFGVDPSDIASSISDEVTVINTVFPSHQTDAMLGDSSMDIVTSIAMFYDLEDPVGFASNIKRLLKPDGVWVFEMSYLPLMLLQNSFDTICHEHLEYYSLAVLETIVGKAGMHVFKAEINDVNGGSIRCYACLDSNVTYGSSDDQSFMHKLRIREFQMALDTDTPYTEFQDRIDNLKQSLTGILFDIRSNNGSIHIYGASTKGNVLLQWYGINRVIVDCAADRNPEKAGSTTLGTDIPIILEEDSRKLKPDYYLVLPWHFKKEFLEREKELIFSGTKMIFPLPEIVIVSKDNYNEALAKSSNGTEQLTKTLLS